MQLGLRPTSRGSKLQVNEHTHPPDPAKIEAEKARGIMKRRAVDTEVVGQV